MSLLQMSISGAIMILAVIVIRALAINRLPKKTFIALWGIVLLRLLVPFSFPSSFSAYSFMNNHTLVPQETVGIQPTTDFPILSPVTDSIWQEQLEASLHPYIIVWGIGMIVCALFFVISYFKCRREFRESLPIKNDFLKKWIAEHKLTRPIEIRQSSRISTPLTYGIFNPIILMPKNTKWDNIQQIEYILTHEFIHIRRFDAATKLFLTAALCIHWFNPLVWAMYILSNRDVELSCDETVILLFGDTTKSAYARTLISMEEKRNSLIPLSNNFSRNAIEERITAIMKTKKITVGAIIISVVVFAIIAILFATSAQNNEMIFVNDRLYISSHKDVSEMVAYEAEQSEYDSPYIGEIKSAVSKSKTPEEELQSNFGHIGSEVIFNGNGVAVNMGGKWIQFTPKDDTYSTIVALIKNFATDEVTLDIVEFVTDDDEERKRELIDELNLTEGTDLSDGNFIDGYYIHNSNQDTEVLKVTNETVYTFIDWNGKYTNFDYPTEFTTTDGKIFKEYIESYDNAQPGMPFFFEIENGIIKKVWENPMP